MNIITTNAPAQRAVQELYSEVNSTSRQCLIILSGGSVSDFIICEHIPTEFKHINPGKIQFALVDERFSRDPHHKNGNAHTIEHVNSFNKFLAEKQIHLHVMLHGSDCNSEAMRYDAFLKARIRDGWIVFAVFGIGEDMHTAGLLPDSEPLKSNSGDYAVCYNSNDEYKYRITITPTMFSHISHAFV